MPKRNMLERLALPMFIVGVLAMVASATVSLSATANATSPVEYKKVTLTYLSSGYSANDSGCGSAQDIYSSNSWNNPSFRARYSSGSNSDKTFLCTATFYMVSDVKIPTPQPIPTVTVIYQPTSSPSPRPTVYPSQSPKPTPWPTFTHRPTPVPMPTWWIRPKPTPSKSPRP
jgi:hypothetical protein